MSIPSTVYPPPFNVTRASHVVLNVTDLARSRAFYGDALGLVVTEQTADTIWLRGMEEACHHSLVLRQAETPSCERIGMRVYTESDLDLAQVWFEKAGLPAQFVSVPGQGRTLQVCDSVGTPLEFCATMPVLPRMLVAFEHHRGLLPLRLDHFQLFTPDVPGACAFYTAMGFRLSEYVALDDTDTLLFGFLQRKGNPHDIVFAHGTGPRLHHFAFLVPDTAHLLHACDVAGGLGFGEALEHGPGRHGPGHAMFAYFRDPDGHRVELFTTHYQVMDIEIEPVRWQASYLRNRPWGLPPRQAWYSEASTFRDRTPTPIGYSAQPFTLETMLSR